jgi:hypothetical protein
MKPAPLYPLLVLALALVAGAPAAAQPTSGLAEASATDEASAAVTVAGYGRVTSPTDGLEIVLPAGQEVVFVEAEVAYETNRSGQSLVALVGGDLRDVTVWVIPTGPASPLRAARSGFAGSPRTAAFQSAGTQRLVTDISQAVALLPVRYAIQARGGEPLREDRVLRISFAMMP